MLHRCPGCGEALPQGLPAWVKDLTAAHVMTSNPVTMGPEDSLMRATEMMRLHSIRRIPIVAGGVLMGILAEGDLKRAQPSTLSDTHEEFERVMESTPVSRIMIPRPLTIVEDTPLLEIARILSSTKFGALPVLRDGVLVGIVTDNDLLKHLTSLLEQAG